MKDSSTYSLSFFSWMVNVYIGSSKCVVSTRQPFMPDEVSIQAVIRCQYTHTCIILHANCTTKLVPKIHRIWLTTHRIHLCALKADFHSSTINNWWYLLCKSIFENQWTHMIKYIVKPSYENPIINYDLVNGMTNINTYSPRVIILVGLEVQRWRKNSYFP